MSHLKEDRYCPINENVNIYNELYKQYIRLYDYFGLPKYSVMKVLKKIKKRINRISVKE